MNKFYALAAAGLMHTSAISFAQPVISNGNNIVLPGFTDTTFSSPGTNVGPAGANVIWDFRSMPLSPGNIHTIVVPSATTYSAAFPSATNAIRYTSISTGATLFYEYSVVNSTGWSIIASGYGGASPKDYTPNTRLRLPFPFSYGNSKTDTYQAVSGNPDSLKITYDGYGTLKIPGATFNNAVRTKVEYSDGTIGYRWYSTSPVMFVISWDQSSGTFVFVGRHLGNTTGVASVAGSEPTAVVYPSPARAALTLRTSSYDHAVLVLFDGLGRAVRTTDIIAKETRIPQGTLPAGVYYYELHANGMMAGRGKMVFE